MNRNKRHKYASSRGYRQNAPGGNAGGRVTPSPCLTQVRPVALGRLRPGSVVWAHVPFGDESGEKCRPVVVESVAGRAIDALPITSSVRRLSLADHVEVLDLTSAGLGRPSGVRRARVLLDRIDLVDVVGQLSVEDHDRVFARDLEPVASEVTVAA